MGKSWMKPQLLHDSGIGLEENSFADIVLIKYHSFCSFMMFTFGLIFFVYSL